MTLWIGRCGLDVALDDPDQFDFSGPDAFTITGELRASSLNEARALRQQLLGHVGETVPVWHDEDTWVGGYATLKSAKVDASGKAMSLVVFTFRFSATFEGSYGHYPTIEMYSYGANRDTATGTPTGLVATPDEADTLTFSGNTGLGSETRSGPGPLGTADDVHVFITTSTQLYGSYNSFTVAPRSFYDMASTLIVDGEVVTGKQIPAVGNLSDWAINNGLLKVEPGSSGTIKITCPDSSPTSSWSAVSREFTPQFYAGGAWADIGQGSAQPADALQVITNQAHEVTLRLVMTILQPAKMRATVDLTLRRGSRVLEIGIACPLALPFGLVAESGTWTTTGASTQVLWTDANDADGNRHAMFSKETRDAANKRFGTSGTSKNYMQVGVAGVVAGDAATGNEDEASLRDQYNAAITETIRFVRS